MVVRDRASMYKAPANRILEPKARNAAKLSTPSKMNAPTVSAKAETAYYTCKNYSDQTGTSSLVGKCTTRLNKSPEHDLVKPLESAHNYQKIFNFIHYIKFILLTAQGISSNFVPNISQLLKGLTVTMQGYFNSHVQITWSADNVLVSGLDVTPGFNNDHKFTIGGQSAGLLNQSNSSYLYDVMKQNYA